MRTIVGATIIRLIFFVQAHSEKAVGNLVDKLVNNILLQAYASPTARSADIDEMTVLKAGHLTMPTSRLFRPLVSLARPAATVRKVPSRRGPMPASATLQFVRGINERSVPDVRLTRSRSGVSGTATFRFKEPSVFEQTEGEVTGLYMVDDEADPMQTTNVQAKFVNGKPAYVEAKYVMRNLEDWVRFMNFMERYALSNDLGYSGS